MHKKQYRQKVAKSESCTNKRQDADAQEQFNADNIAKPSVILNQMVMGNINNENSFPSGQINKDRNSFLLELILNENQSFVLEQLRENDMVANVKETSKRDYNNSESFISDQAKDPNIDMNAIKLRRKESKRNRKIIQKLIFQKAIYTDVSAIQ